MTTQLELHIPGDDPYPGEADPKTLRHWLFAGFVSALEWAADQAEPTTRPAHMGVPPGAAGEIVEYYIANERAFALRQAARAAERAMRTREEYMIFNRENSHLSPPGEAELECARHHDRCTICMSHEDIAQRQDEESERLEQVRVILMSGVHDILRMIENDREAARIGDDSTLTLAIVEKALKRTSAAAYNRWQKRGAR